MECEQGSGRHRLLWTVVSVSLFITIIESDNRVGEWRKVKDNHRRVIREKETIQIVTEMERGYQRRTGGFTGSRPDPQLAPGQAGVRGSSSAPQNQQQDRLQVTSPPSCHPNRHPTRHQSHDSVKWTLPSFFFAMVTL